MPQIEVRTPHALPPGEVAERLRRFGEALKKKHGDKVTLLKEEWLGETLDFSLVVQGITISGKLTVSDQQVTVISKVPLTAMLFRGRIEKDIQSGIRDALADNP